MISTVLEPQASKSAAVVDFNRASGRRGVLIKKSARWTPPAFPFKATSPEGCYWSEASQTGQY
jgi:hypothetical protein